MKQKSWQKRLMWIAALPLGVLIYIVLFFPPIEMNRIAANESAAVGHLRNVFPAQEKFRASTDVSPLICLRFPSREAIERALTLSIWNRSQASRTGVSLNTSLPPAPRRCAAAAWVIFRLKKRGSCMSKSCTQLGLTVQFYSEVRL